LGRYRLIVLTYEDKIIDPEKIADIEIPEPYYDFLKRTVH